MRRSAFVAAGLAAALSLPVSPAQARTIDLSKAKCSEFTGLSSGDRDQIVLWLAGYYAGAAQRPALDTDQLSKTPAALAALCEKTPAAALIGEETRALFLKPVAQ